MFSITGEPGKVSLKVRKISLLVKGVVSLAFFSILISFVQTNQLIKLFADIDWFYLLLSFILSPVMIVVSCIKWKMILDAGGKSVPFMTLFRIYLIGYFFSNMLPSTVGGDVVRSYYSGKLIEDQSYSAIAIFLERFSGMFFLFFLVIVSPLFLPGLYASPYVSIPVAGAFLLICFTFWIARVQDPYILPNRCITFALVQFGNTLRWTGYKKSDILLKKITAHYNAIMKRVVALHEKLGLVLSTILHDKKLFCKLLLITALFYLLVLVNVSFAFLAFGIDHPFLQLCALVPTITFVSQFPVTLLGNLGFMESVFVFYFLIINISGSASLAMGLLLRVKMLCMGVVGFLVYLVYKQQTGDDAQNVASENV